MDEDDGDYATLRELPLPPASSQRLSSGEDTASEEGKVSPLVYFTIEQPLTKSHSDSLVYDQNLKRLSHKVVRCNLLTTSSLLSICILL